MAEERIDPIRLQDTLDDIIGSVDWGVRYMESLMESGDSPDYDSDLPGLKADLHRLRVVADALVPGRVIDRDTGRRWFLAPDDATQRLAAIEHHLDTADRAVDQAFTESQKDRDRRATNEKAAAEAKAELRRKQEENVKRVKDYLRDRDGATANEIGDYLGISEYAAESAAKEAGAKRSKDKRFRLGPQDRPTQPHTDACPECSNARDGKWWVLAYAAEREEPGEYDGYVAFYRCERGHYWQTGWADDTRLTPNEIEETIRTAREMFERPDESE